VFDGDKEKGQTDDFTDCVFGEEYTTRRETHLFAVLVVVHALVLVAHLHPLAKQLRRLEGKGNSVRITTAREEKRLRVR
jgi:hypothetical protein